MEHQKQETHPWNIEVFHDGECPLCAREIEMLRRLDRHGRILFTDISSDDFVPETQGKDLETLMSTMHGRLPDGTWLTGVEVFRRLYTAVGFGPIVAVTRSPVLSGLLNWSYERFAKNRLRLTGRCEIEVCTAPNKEAA